MAGLWKRSNEITNSSGVTVGASATVAVTKEVRVTPGGANEALRVDVVCSSVTASSGITAKLQQDIAGTWTDVTGLSVAVTGNGTFSFLMNARSTAAGYFSSLPLSNKVRLVMATGVGDAVTVDAAYITMED
jgi:hypothetical protein